MCLYVMPAVLHCIHTIREHHALNEGAVSERGIVAGPQMHLV